MSWNNLRVAYSRPLGEEELAANRYAHAREDAMAGCRANTRRAHATGTALFLDWLEYKPFTVREVRRWVDALLAQGKSTSTINLRIGAVRRLAKRAHECGMMAAEEAMKIQGVENLRGSGRKQGNWLNTQQLQELLDKMQPAASLGEHLDLAIFALLVGCGLRRGEASALKVGNLGEVDRHEALINLPGKGSKNRTVGVPDWAHKLIQQWISAAGITSGFVLRQCNQMVRVSESGISGTSINRRVKKFVTRHMGKSFSSHGLRKSHAREAYLHGATVDEVSHNLGHSSSTITRLYIGDMTNMERVPGDLIPLRVKTL